MLTATRRLLLSATALALSFPAVPARADTVISYQGRVLGPSGPISGTCDLRFRLYEELQGGAPVGSVVCLDNVPLSAGVFSVNLDFGDQFTGSPRFLEIDVRPNSPADCSEPTGFQPLSQRQQVIAVPYARYSETTRGLTVSYEGLVGIGTTSPQFALDVVGAAGDIGYGGRAVQLAAGNGYETTGGKLLLSGGNSYIGALGGNGGATTLSGGEGGFGIPGGIGGDVVLQAGNGGGSGWADRVGVGGSIVLRPGRAGVPLAGGAGAAGIIKAQGPMVVDQSGPSSLKIGKFDTSSAGNTTLILATTAATNGFCYIQGVGSAGASFGQLVLNPDGGAVAKPGGGSFANYSDARLKADIQPLTGTLDRLLRLRGCTYRYTDEARSTRPLLGGTQTGLIAQEVQMVFPEWIDTDRDGFLMVTERSTTALMVESLRDLRAEKDIQLAQRDARLQALERENAELRQRLERENADLKSRLDRLERAANK